jgi:hypothetical protein
MLKEPPILKIFFGSVGYDTPRNHLRIRISRRIRNGYQKYLGQESGANMGLIHEKNRGQKSRATVPLRIQMPMKNSGIIIKILNIQHLIF